MNVLVIGANGRTGRLVVSAAVAAGHEVGGMIRDASQAPTQRKLGAHPVTGDVTGVLSDAMAGRDAVVFAAGGGGEDRNAVDYDGVVNAVHAAEAAGIRRFVLISSRYADRPDEGPEFLRPALTAKGRSEAVLAASRLDWTIIRPGGLTDEPGTALIELGTWPGPGRVPRADVAAVAVAALSERSTVSRAFDLLAGEIPIPDALARLPTEA